ncbi:unnamed protein product [Urochloa humidicola]
MCARVACAAAEKESGPWGRRRHGAEGLPATAAPPLRHISPPAAFGEDRRATSTGRARKPHAASPRKPTGSGAEHEELEDLRVFVLLSLFLSPEMEEMGKKAAVHRCALPLAKESRPRSLAGLGGEGGDRRRRASPPAALKR